MIDVLIICGGEGSRLHKAGLPSKKILIKFSNLFIFQFLFDSLINIKHKQINFISNKIISKSLKKEFNSINKKNVQSIKFLVEDFKMGTAGFFIKNLKIFKDIIFIIYGDLFINTDLSKIYKRFIKDGYDMMIIGQDNGHPKDSDLLKFDKTNKITSIIKKPHSFKTSSKSKVLSLEPIIICKKKIFQNISFSNGSIDLIHDILPNLINSKKFKIGIYNFEDYKNINNYIIDCGTPERYKLLKSMFG